MSEIYEKLPSSIQIMIYTYLTLPNERILLVGENGVGKTSFIENCRTHSQTSPCIFQDPSGSFICHTINPRVKMAEMNSTLIRSNNIDILHERLDREVNKPTRVIVMASVVNRDSIQKAYNYFIPLLILWKIPISVILTHVDKPLHLWHFLDLHKLKQRLYQSKIFDSLYWVSNESGKGIYHEDLNYIHHYL
jgi:GTP-binding protein EngB required for normal cell division